MVVIQSLSNKAIEVVIRDGELAGKMLLGWLRGSSHYGRAWKHADRSLQTWRMLSPAVE